MSVTADIHSESSHLLATIPGLAEALARFSADPTFTGFAESDTTDEQKRRSAVEADKRAVIDRLWNEGVTNIREHATATGWTDEQIRIFGTSEGRSYQFTSGISLEHDRTITYPGPLNPRVARAQAMLADPDGLTPKQISELQQYLAEYPTFVVATSPPPADDVDVAVHKARRLLAQVPPSHAARPHLNEDIEHVANRLEPKWSAGVPDLMKRIQAAIPAKPDVSAVVADSVAVAPTPWLQDDVLISGALSILTGSPGVGKGVWTAHDVALLTRTGERVMWVVGPGEDSADTIAARLRVAGADLSLVRIVSEGADLSEDYVEKLEMLHSHAPFEVLVLDSFAALATKGNLSDQGDIRRMLKPLNEMLARTGVAGLLIHHNRKGGASEGGSAADRAAGSVQIQGACRIMLMIDFHPEDRELALSERRRMIATVKTNGSATVYSLVFRPLSTEVPGKDGKPMRSPTGSIFTVPRVEVCEGETVTDADFTTEGQQKIKDTADGAIALIDYLREHPGWCLSGDVRKGMAPIQERTFQRLVRKMLAEQLISRGGPSNSPSLRLGGGHVFDGQDLAT